MSKKCDAQVDYAPEYGAFIKFQDIENADLFEDFLTERCFVFFNTKFDSAEAIFYFGQASSVEKVADLLNKFEAQDQTL